MKLLITKKELKELDTGDIRYDLKSICNHVTEFPNDRNKQHWRGLRMAYRRELERRERYYFESQAI